jgi:hypothetical protein
VRKSDQVIMIVAALVGFGHGLALVLTFPQRHAFWMAFAVAAATAAGALADYGSRPRAGFACQAAPR